MKRWVLGYLLIILGLSYTQEVVVYTALDREFSEAILSDFEKETGIKVKKVFDTEVDKSVGLVNKLIMEANRPRCDVFWNNEIINTLRLKRKGLLISYQSPFAQSIPDGYKDPENYWTGFAARARVFLINPDQLPDQELPKSVEDLTNPKWKRQGALAIPRAGTTATHFACLLARWGKEKTEKFIQQLQANQVSFETGNKQVALKVANGQIAIGLTDTDDAIIEVRKNPKLKIIFPDGAEKGTGILFIPNTVAIIKGCPNLDNAKKLVDYLLSPQTEKKLALCPSAQIPLNLEVRAEVSLPFTIPKTIMDPSFEQAAELFDTTQDLIRQLLLR